MKTLLVTGGAGFIGSNLVRHLHRRHPDYRIVALDALTYAGRPANLDPLLGGESRVIFQRGDVCNAALVEQLVATADVVVHLAAESHVLRSIVDDRLFFETDVIGTRTVANAVVRQQAHIERFIHVSSSDVYGSAEREPMDENHPLNPTNPYAAAKAGADRLVYSYWRTFGIPAVIVRPFNVYGPRQHVEKLIPRFITSLLANEPLTVHGPGTAARDWLHVDDLCTAFDQLLERDMGSLAGQVFNIGSGTAADVLTIAQCLSRLTGEDTARIEHVADRLGQVTKQVADVERARDRLRWTPRVELEDGLARTVQWYLDNRAWWEPLHRMRRTPAMASRGSVALQ